MLCPYENLTPEDAERFMERYHNSVTGRAVVHTIPHAVRKAMAEIVGKSTLIDVGCGKGFEVREYYSPFQYLGIDPSPRLIQIAKAEQPRFHFIVGRGENLPVPAESYDYSLCKSVLEHVRTESEATTIFDELIRVARKAALVAWHTPPHDGPAEFRELHGYIPDPLWQSRWNAAAFARPHVAVEKLQVENFELWICRKQ